MSRVGRGPPSVLALPQGFVGEGSVHHGGCPPSDLVLYCGSDTLECRAGWGAPGVTGVGIGEQRRFLDSSQAEGRGLGQTWLSEGRGHLGTTGLCWVVPGEGDFLVLTKRGRGGRTFFRRAENSCLLPILSCEIMSYALGALKRRRTWQGILQVVLAGGDHSLGNTAGLVVHRSER